MTLIKNLVIIALVVLVVNWSWQRFSANQENRASDEPIPESDKVCRIVNADTGACVCTHRQTQVRLDDISHEECHRRALESR